jgi:FAD:protein FMN transferase
MRREIAPRRRAFRSMGTNVELLGGGSEASFERAARRVESIFACDDQRFSRFRSDSELAMVNASGGAWVEVSPPFLRLLERAVDGARRSGGLFDPTVLGAIESAGYDRDFDEIGWVHGGVSPEPPSTAPNWRAIRLRGRRVQLRHGIGLDFGGIAKGWAVDRAALAASRFVPWALVNAGGDLRLVGRPPHGSLEVGIEEPLDPGSIASRIHLERGGMATSSKAARTWGPGLHHLIDPRTSRPAATEVEQATAWADSCTEAEIRSKWALLAGAPALDRFPAILFLAGDRILTNVAAAESA